jgi:hypothetical protein
MIIVLSRFATITKAHFERGEYSFKGFECVKAGDAWWQRIPISYGFWGIIYPTVWHLVGVVVSVILIDGLMFCLF